MNGGMCRGVENTGVRKHIKWKWNDPKMYSPSLNVFLCISSELSSLPSSKKLARSPSEGKQWRDLMYYYYYTSLLCMYLRNITRYFSPTWRFTTAYTKCAWSCESLLHNSLCGKEWRQMQPNWGKNWKQEGRPSRRTPEVDIGDEIEARKGE